nr:unnamed protein product [Callosobruchus analis]
MPGTSGTRMRRPYSKTLAPASKW